MNKPNEELDVIESVLDKLRKLIREKEDEFYNKGAMEIAKVASSISTDSIDAIDKIKKNKNQVLKFIELAEKFKDSPEELIYLLSLADIPAVAGSGKQIAEAVAGFRGLGIETIDYKIDEIKYENISSPRGDYPLSEISITSFIYRVPPFELTKCPHESGEDKDITDLLGSRFVWMIKPAHVSWDSWNGILQKTTGGKPSAVIKGSYTFEGSLLVPKTIELLNLSARSLILEVSGRYPFFLKFGSSVIEKDSSILKTKIKLLEYLRGKSAELPKLIGPYLASWRLRLDYPYFCYKGLGLSIDPFDAQCPFKKLCSLSSEKGGPCDGKIFWSGKYHKRRFYPKSYPLRRLRIGRASGLIVWEDELPPSLVSFTAYDKKHVESRWYAVEIGTWFINARPTVRIFFDNEIGYSIPTSVMSFSFNREWLIDVVKNILTNEDVKKNITVKYILYKALGRTLDYKRLSKTVKELMNSESDLAKMYKETIEATSIKDEIIDFAKKVLLHSLEHLLTQYILEKFAGVDMNFVLTKYYHTYTDEIFLAENAKNGKIGIVDTITKKISQEGLSHFLYEFADWLSSYLGLHSNDFDKLSYMRMEEAKKTLTQSMERLERGDAKERDIVKSIRKVAQKVEEFKKALDAMNVCIDITLARTVLLAGDIITESDVEQIGDYFDDILERYGFKLCLDGCNGCVRLEKYCGEGIQQTLTTSRLLLHQFAQYLRDLILRGVTIRSNELGKILQPIMFQPKRSLDILSPYISPSYAQKLVQLASQGIKVRIITWMPKKEDESYEFQKDSLKILKDNLGENLLVRIQDKPDIKLVHDKTYIIDNIAITGSFNLTESGFYGNFERADIKPYSKTVKQEKEEYEKLWKGAIELSCYEIS